MPAAARPVVVALAALALGAPSAARAAWQEEPMPGTTGALAVRSLVTDGGGQALTLFEAFGPGRRTATTARRGGTWTSAADIAGLGWGDARAFTYGSTRALLVTLRVTGHGAYDRARFGLAWAPGRSDGRFEALRAIAPSAIAPAAAVDPAGAGVVAFTRQGGSVVYASARPAGGGFGTPQALSAAGAGTVAAAINDHGDRMVAWMRAGRIEVRVRRAGAAWGSVQTAARIPAIANGRLAALVAPSGRLAVTWAAADVREGQPVRLETRVAVHPVGGSWAQATVTSATLGTSAFAADPTAIPLLDADGRLLVASTGPHGAGTGVLLTDLTNAARIRSTTVVSGASQAATLDDAATGPHGALAVTWAEHDAAGGVRTFAALRPAPGPLGAPEALTPDGQAGLAGSRVVYGAGGQPIVVRPFVSGAGALVADVSTG